MSIPELVVWGILYVAACNVSDAIQGEYGDLLRERYGVAVSWCAALALPGMVFVGAAISWWIGG